MTNGSANNFTKSASSHEQCSNHDLLKYNGSTPTKEVPALQVTKILVK